MKISGYILAEWQKADTAGINSMAGGNFPAVSDNRFMVREARIKFLYGTDLNQFVMQFDVTEKGMSTKDMYLKMTDPYINWFSILAGIMNRPFGWEIAYSSADRESPERARFTQTLFPQERDEGAELSINPKSPAINFLHLDAGVYNGDGINPGLDSRKDIIGHLWMKKNFMHENFSFGAGVSMYEGYVFQGTKYIYKMGDLASGVKGFVVDSNKLNLNNYTKRQYLGFDAQVSVITPAGLTTLRGEYVTGTQPGSSSTSTSPTTTLPNYDTYIRKFSAMYIYFVQNILQTKHQIVVKYDVYDPNTDIAGTDINATVNKVKTKLTTTDIKYSTIGLGWIYHLNNNLKFMVYYDIVTNEKTGITGSTSLKNFTKDIPDNVWTVRLEYKF